MSKTIDEKVVEMQFDNQQFEKNINKSMSSIDNLKKSLNFQESAKGFDNISNAAKGVSLESLTSGISEVKSGFSALEVAAITALATIVNKATDAGLHLVKELSLDQVTAGWDRYAEKTGAVQTIMAATGDSIDDVSKQLERLSWFTDETSYNFSDMVNNIGKFTANQVPLEQAVTSMEGIANWAAISGQQVQAASRAMYNMSQALGSGSVMLRDWMSIENANMATAEFKQTVMDTAVEMGTLVKVGNQYMTVAKGTAVTVGNFRSTLSDAWFNSDVLLKTLEKYGSFSDKLYDSIQTLNESAEGVDITASVLLDAMEKYDGSVESLETIAIREGVVVEDLKSVMDGLGDETLAFGQKAFRAAQEATTFEQAINSVKDAVSSRWMEIFELIFGNYVEAKKLWTDLANYLYDIFTEDLWTFEELLAEWKDLGGRDTLFEGLYNAFDNFKNILFTIKEALADVFPPITGKRLAELSQKFADFTKNLLLNEAELSRIKNTIEAIISPIKIAFTLIKTALEFITPILSNVILPVARGILDVIFAITGGIGQAVTRIQEAVSNFEGLHNLASKWNKLLEPVQKGITNFFNTVSGSIDSFFSKIYEQIDLIKEIGFTAWFKDLLDKISESSKAGAKFVEILYKIKNAFDVVKNKAGNIFKNIKGYFQELNGISFNNFKKALSNMSPETAKLVEKINNLHDSFMRLFNKVKNSTFVQDVRNIFTRSADEVQGSKFLDVISKVLNLLIDLGVLLAQVLKPIFVNLWDIIKNVSLALIDFVEELVGNINIDTLFRGGIAAGIIAIAKSFKDFMDSTSGFRKNISNILESVRGVLVSWQNSINADTMQKIAGAVAALVGALLVLSFIDEDALIKGVSVIAMLMVGLTYATKQIISFKQSVSSFDTLLKSVTNSYKIKSIMASLIELGIAVVIFAEAIKILSKVDIGKSLPALGEIILAIGAMFGLMVGLDKLVTQMDSVKIATYGYLFIEIAGAMAILAVAMKMFGNLDEDALLKGAAVIVGFLAALMSEQIGLNRLSKGNTRSLKVDILEVAAAIGILAITAKMLTNTPWESIGKAGTILTGFLGILAAFQWFMTSQTFDSTYFKKTTQGMWEFVGVLTVLSLVVKLFNNTSWESIGKAGAVLGGFLAIIAGATGVAYLLSKIKGLDQAVKTFSLSVERFGIGIGATGVGILAFAESLRILARDADLVPKAFEALGKGLIELLRVLAQSASEIAEFLSEIIYGVFELFIRKAATRIKSIAEEVVVMLVQVLQIVDAHADELTQLLMDILIKVLKGVSERIDELLVYAIDIIESLLGSIGAALGDNVGNIFGLEAFIASMAIIIKGLAKLKADIKDAIEVAVLIAAFAAAMSAIMVVLSGLDPVAVGVNTGCLVLLTGFMAEVVKLFSKMDVNIAAVVKGALALVAAAAIIMVGFEVIVIIMGAIAGLVGLVSDDVQNTVKRGFDFLIEIAGKIGELFGAFAGGIIAGFAKTVSAALPEVADNLSTFMTKLQPFLEGLNQLKDGESKIKALMSLLELFGLLVAAKALATFDSITSLGGLLDGIAFDDISRNLTKFVGVVRDFYDEIKTELPKGSETRVQNVVTAAQGMISLAEQIITNKTTLSGMGEVPDLADFGTKIVSFITSMNDALDKLNGGYDSNAIAAFDSAITVGQKFNDLALQLGTNNWGSFDELFNGTNLDLGDLGEDIQQFITFLNRTVFMLIADKIDYSSDNVKAAFDGIIYIAGRLVDLQNAMPTDTTFGLKQGIDGVRRLSLGEFGANIINLGTGISSFIKSTSDATVTENHSKVIELIQALANMDIPESEGIFGLKTMINGTAFKSTMTSLGQGLKQFSKEVDGIKNYDKINNSIQPLTSLGWLIAGLDEIGTDGALGFAKALKEVALGLDTFVESSKKASSGKDGNPGYTLAINIASGIVDGINFSRPWLILAFSSLFNDINDALNPGGENSTGYAFAISYTSGIVDGINFSRPFLIELFTNLVADITKVFNNSSIGLSVGIDVGKNIVSGVEQSEENIISSTLAIFEKVKDTFNNNAAGMIDVGKYMISYLITGMNQETIRLQNISSSLYSTLENVFTSKYKSMNTIGKNLINNLKEGMETNSDYLNKKAKSIVDNLNTIFDNLKDDLSKTGKSAMKSYAQGLLDNTNKPLEIAFWTGKAVVSKLTDGSSGSYTVGWDFTEGFIQGMESLAYASNWSAWTIGHNAIAYLKAGTKSNSPSKAAREIGGFVGEGFVLGIEDTLKSVQVTAYQMGNSSIEALKDALSKAADYAENNLDTNITIRPVLDLSEIQNGVNGINGILGNSDYQLGSVSGRLASSISLGSTSEQLNPVYNDSKVISAIDTLGERVDGLNEAMSKIKVVLDSGEVVGGISNKMNKRFGEMEFAVARGVR